jgi:hypothetical protein
MSTNSTIAIKNQDGTVDQIYCTWDGDLSYNGKILFENYSDIDKILQLIALGNLSVLKPTIEECTFQTRDRNEDWYRNKPNEFETLESYYKFMKSNSCKFNYLFVDNQWLVSEGNTSFYRLDDALLFADIEIN